MVLWRMINRFFGYLRCYDEVLSFMDAHPVIKQDSVMSGEYSDFFSSRWRYAWKMMRIEWKHRDRYSRKCKRDCFHCNAKHC